MIQILSYWPSLLGGLLIGTSAGLLLVLHGRVAGISSIAGTLLGQPNGDTGWRLAFVIGLIAGPLALAAASGHLPTMRMVASAPVLIMAGLLVGYGTRMGAGCTSGHGVCGLARLSPRSLAAVATFMAAGIVTVFLVRHTFAGVWL